MINWILLGIFVLAGLALLNMEHHSKKFKMILLLFVGLLVYFSVNAVFNSSGADFSTPRSIINAIYVYFGWLGQTLGNLWDIGVQTTGKVVDAVNFSISR